MNYLSDGITYMRRIIKAPSNDSFKTALCIDYWNRFVLEVQMRLQLFDFKTKYQFQTTPGIVDYNMPLYSIQTESTDPLQTIASYPVYQGFMAPAFVDGFNLSFYTQRDLFYNYAPFFLNPINTVATGDGSTTNFTFTLPYFPAIPGHLDLSGIVYSTLSDPIFATSFSLNAGAINLPSTSFYPRVYINYTTANGSNATIADSGVFLSSATDSNLYGLLMTPGQPPFGNTPIGGNVYSMTANTVNYNTGVVNVTFPIAPPANTPINAQCYFYNPGMPQAILFYNNTLTVDVPPQTQYLIELDAYLTPAAYFSTSQALPFGYMTEYLARGAARKILSDTGDIEQFNFYEPLFKEQEMLVWKRAQRQTTSTRTSTIYSGQQGGFNYNTYGQGFN